MKATTLIQQLAAQVAKNGDLEVFIPCAEADRFRCVFDSGVRVASVVKESGNRLQYLSANRASQLGYDAAGVQTGLVIG